MGLILFDSRQTISGANQAVNTWHVGCAAQPTNAESNSILAAVKAFWDALVAYRVTGSNVVSGSRMLYANESTWVKPTFGPDKKMLTPGKWGTEPIILGATPTTSISGTGGSALPGQLASVVSWRTAVAGRSGRGRTYLGNLAAAAQSGSLLNAGMVSIVNTAAATLLTAVAAVSGAGGPYNLGVWSPTKGLIRPILSGSSDATFDTMRSRVK